MAIEVVEDIKTVRTYPRLMRNMSTKDIVLTLSDATAESGGIIYLNGDRSGLRVAACEVHWEAFEDFHGSVTVWNKD